LTEVDPKCCTVHKKNMKNIKIYLKYKKTYHYKLQQYKVKISFKGIFNNNICGLLLFI